MMQQIQRTLDFDAARQRPREHVAAATSQPPPNELPPPPLVRPDRQLTYDGIDPAGWPPPHHDRDTISVDRHREDIDGPSHRFVIVRGDDVEVYLGNGRFEQGIVTGISHHNQEVRVAHSVDSGGLWYAKESIYPAPEDAGMEHPGGERRSRSATRFE